MTFRLSRQRFYFRVWYYFLPAISFLLVTWMRFRFSVFARLPADHDWNFYFAVAAMASLIWILVAEHNRLCQVDELFQEHTGIKKVFPSCAETYLMLLFVLFFYRQQSLSRSVLALSAVCLFVLALVSRAVFRNLLRGSFNYYRRLRVLVVGADAHALRIAEKLSHVPFVRSEIIGWVRLPGQDMAIGAAPVFDFDDVSRGLPVSFDDVVIAVPPERLPSLSSVVHRLEPLCAPIHTVLDFGEVPIVRERLFRFGDLQFLDLATSPLESPDYFLLKRSFDIGFSATALLLLSPLMLAIAAAVKLTSPGPVLFRQERVGLNGNRFRMYKFRTMRMEDHGDGDTRWTTPNDNRRTTVGRILRKLSLDELPQFLNVLRGEMSVVGPRPERPYFVDKFLTEVSLYDSRHRLKVGITGWAQVNGWRGDTSIAKRLEFDRYYLQNWSLWFDFRIVALTIWAAIFGKNAY